VSIKILANAVVVAAAVVATTVAPRQSVAAEQEGGKAGRYGTCVDFVNNPVKAAQKAAKEGKLLFEVHISGNFEDEHFT
jgi:hypothetical protein